MMLSLLCCYLRDLDTADSSFDSRHGAGSDAHAHMHRRCLVVGHIHLEPSVEPWDFS